MTHLTDEHHHEAVLRLHQANPRNRIITPVSPNSRGVLVAIGGVPYARFVDADAAQSGAALIAEFFPGAVGQLVRVLP